MIKEDKQLLLKDLCARLPYGFIVHRYSDNCDITFKQNELDEFAHFLEYSEGEIFKPYLRPMSSMTEEERRKFVSIMNVSAKMTADEEHPKLIFDKTIAIRENGVTTVLDYSFEAFDLLNKNMLDYRGLIDKGLALEALEGMYK